MCLNETSRWQGEYRNCSEMFKVKKTDDGYCCAFNTFEVSEVGFYKEKFSLFIVHSV